MPKKEIKITEEELNALFTATQSEELQGGIMPIFSEAKIVLNLDLEWGVWKKGGMAECWAWGIGQWLQRYRWKGVSGTLRNLKKRLEKLYLT